MSVAGSTTAENIMIDGIGVGDIGNIVLRDRRILSEDGILWLLWQLIVEKNELFHQLKLLLEVLFTLKQVKT